MDHSEQIEIAYQLVNSDKYTEALVCIENIREKGCDDVILSLYEALCVYEAENDVESLRLLSLFLSKAGNHQKREYALFTTGICLMNLGLASEALEVFSQISNSYPDIEVEREKARNKFEAQKEGIVHYSRIRGRKNA